MIFCVMNPISIGPKELEQIGREPDKSGEFQRKMEIAAILQFDMKISPDF